MKDYKILCLLPSYPSDEGVIPAYEYVRIACCNLPENAIRSGKAISLPLSEFDIQNIIGKIPDSWQPDLISIKRNLCSSLVLNMDEV